MHTRIAHILSPHGIKGELKAYAVTDRPESYKDWKTLFVGKTDDNPTEYTLTELRYNSAKNTYIIRLQEIQDRNTAETMRGLGVFVPDELLDDEDTEPFEHEIIGFSVFDQNGLDVGKVKGYFDNGAHGVLEIMADKEYLLPYTDDIITACDTENKRLDVNIYPGFMD